MKGVYFPVTAAPAKLSGTWIPLSFRPVVGLMSIAIISSADGFRPAGFTSISLGVTPSIAFGSAAANAAHRIRASTRNNPVSFFMFFPSGISGAAVVPACPLISFFIILQDAAAPVLKKKEPLCSGSRNPVFGDYSYFTLLPLLL